MRLTLRDVISKQGGQDAKEKRGNQTLPCLNSVNESYGQVADYANLEEVIQGMEEDINISWRWNTANQDKLAKNRKDHKTIAKTLEMLENHRQQIEGKLEACKLDSGETFTKIQ